MALGLLISLFSEPEIFCVNFSTDKLHPFNYLMLSVINSHPDKLNLVSV